MDINELKGLLGVSEDDKKGALNMGLLQAGLGILANNTSRNAGPALAKGGMMGLQGYQQSLDTAQKEKMQSLQMKKLLEELNNAEIVNKLKADWMKKFSGQSPATGAAPSGISANSLSMAGLSPSMATPPTQQAGAFPLSLNDVAIGKMLGMPDMLPDLKVANEGFEKKPGSFYDIPGKDREYVGDPTKGITFNNGAVSLMPGAVAAQSALAGGITGAQEQAKANLDPLTVNAASGPVMTTRGRAVQSMGRPADFPVVTPQQQAGRDSDRKSIVAAELNNPANIGQPGYAALQKEAQFLGIPLKTEAVIAREKAQAEADVKRGVEKPQEAFSLTAATGTIDNALKQIDYLKNARGLGNITGPIMGRTGNITGVATNAQADLDTLKAQIGVQVLTAMREASKTGGAVGQVTEREWPILQNQLGSLHQMQTTAQFKRGLADVEATLTRINTAYKQEFKDKYGARNVMSEADKIIGAK